MGYPKKLRLGLGLGIKYGQPAYSGIYTRSPYYLQLDGVASYGQLERDIVIPAGDDFEISVDFLSEQISFTVCSLGGDPNNRIVLDNPTRMWLVFGGSFNIVTLTDNSWVGDNNYHSLKVVRLANIVSMYIDGSQVISPIAISHSAGFSRFGGAVSGSGVARLLGILANPYIKNLTTGQVLVDCSIDQKGSDIQTNRADPTNNLQLFNVDHGTDWFTRWENGDYVPSRFPYLIEMQTAAGLADYSYSADRYWTFGEPMGTEEERPAVTLDEETTVRLYTDDYSGELKDNGTDVRVVFDVVALSNLSFYASFGNCTNLTGDISALSNLSYWASFSNCTNLTGDISALNNLSYLADFYNCTNLTGDISALSNCSRRAHMRNCSGVSGYFVNPHPQMYEIQLDGTAMSPNDTDQTLIALDANTARTDGNMSIVANRTSASDAAYNALIARGWTITEVPL